MKGNTRVKIWITYGNANVKPEGTDKPDSTTHSRMNMEINIKIAELAHSLPNNCDRFCPRSVHRLSNRSNFGIRLFHFSSKQESTEWCADLCRFVILTPHRVIMVAQSNSRVGVYYYNHVCPGSRSYLVGAWQSIVPKRSHWRSKIWVEIIRCRP